MDFEDSKFEWWTSPSSPNKEPEVQLLAAHCWTCCGAGDLVAEPQLDSVVQRFSGAAETLKQSTSNPDVSEK